MALLSPHLERFLLLKNLHHCTNSIPKTSTLNKTNLSLKANKTQCSAIAIDAPSSLTDVGGIRWGSASVQGPREEMEDDIILRSDGLDGFSFAAVFDGHGGFSSVSFLRDQLYKECVAGLQGGKLLSGKDFNSISEALKETFEKVDAKLLNWLEMNNEDDESGATATAVFVGNDMMIISHIGDSCVVLSNSGKAEVLTDPHRPYGSNKASLQEIRRIREAGGWITNGRICGDIAVSRAFGDMRFKTKKNEMLKKGVEEGRWSEKFCSRIQFTGDLVVASPDTFQVPLDLNAEFILLASDGLWDYIKSSDAVAFVRNKLRQHGDVQIACEELAGEAIDRGSQDNVSIIIADLGRTDWKNLQVQQANVVFEFGQAFATIGIVSLGIWISSQILSSTL